MASEAGVDGAPLQVFSSASCNIQTGLAALVLAPLGALVSPAGLLLQDCPGPRQRRCSSPVTLQFELCVLEAQTGQFLQFLQALIHQISLFSSFKLLLSC